MNSKIKKLVGLTKQEFDEHIQNGHIFLQEARLLPQCKPGDEGALTSIFLSTLRLVKEYRNDFFKEIKLSKGGKVYYYTEVTFPKNETHRPDGLIIVVKGGVIRDAVFFEMKNKNNNIDAQQISKYIDLSKQLKVDKLVTVSNEFVADPSHSPVKVKLPSSFSLYHFSWKYLMTIGQLLIFENDHNIEDEDQLELMKEVLKYFEHKDSGVSGYTQMKPGWKELSENIFARKTVKVSDQYVEDAVVSWYEEEKDMTLLLSRMLGVMVRSAPKKKDSLAKDKKQVKEKKFLNSVLSVKNSVSDIKISADFERRNVEMSVRIIPPQDKKTLGKIGWIRKQVDNCNKRSEETFQKIKKYIYVEADVKFARDNIREHLEDIEELIEKAKFKEIQAFRITVVKDFGANFSSVKNFISFLEELILFYYEGIVQHMTNWNKPAPKLVK